MMFSQIEQRLNMIEQRLKKIEEKPENPRKGSFRNIRLSDSDFKIVAPIYKQRSEKITCPITRARALRDLEILTKLRAGAKTKSLRYGITSHTCLTAAHALERKLEKMLNYMKEKENNSNHI